MQQILEIWKASFTKYDIGRCFEEIAGYFYTKAFYDNELKTYGIETGLPTHANDELHELIFKRYEECKASEDEFGQVYYLNLLYNYHDEKSKESLSIDSMLTNLLRKIEL